MSNIYNYIPSYSIICLHDYSYRDLIVSLTNVLFRTSNTNFLSFQSQLGIVDDKCISITNRQLSFLPTILNHFLGNEYAICLQNEYKTILTDKNIITVDEPVYQFFDYDSVSGTGHAYDLMFYLLFNYINTNQRSKLLVVKSNNQWYNKILDLIKKWYNVEYYIIEESITYKFTDFTCAQTYQNILFHDVKEFISKTLITPIVTMYDNNNFKWHTNIYKIKVATEGNTSRLNMNYVLTDEFKSFCSLNNYYSVDNYTEEEKIYILNKATNIIVTWGSSWYININYYINTLSDKFIYIIFHPEVSVEYNFLLDHGDCIQQNMPLWASGGYINQIYNTTTFSGKKMIVSSLSELPLYIHH